MISDKQIQRLVIQCEQIEANIANLKDELLMQMMLEQEKLNRNKFDRKNYFIHKLK